MSEPSGGLRDAVARALAEDAPAGDLTTSLTVPEHARCRAELRSKASGVLAGVKAAQRAFDLVAEQDELGRVEVAWEARDGDRVEPGSLIAVSYGPARSVLRAERVAPNRLAHLSGGAAPRGRMAGAAARPPASAAAGV